MSDGSKVTSIYGHVDPLSGIDLGVSVTKGQQIGTVIEYCYGDHVHFGIYNGSYSDIACSAIHNCNTAGYGTIGNYKDPVKFVQDNQIDCTDYSSEISAVKTSYGSFIGTATNDPHLYYQNGEYSDNVCIRDYDASGSSDGTSAILFDYDGGANQAYLIRSGFWNHYANTCDGPSGNCNQNGVVDCGAPLNNEYVLDNGSSRQDFQTCYFEWDGQSQAYPYRDGYDPNRGGCAPGWFNDTDWNPTISYAFAEAYDRHGAATVLGDAFDNGDGAGVHYWGNDDSLPLLQDFYGSDYGHTVLMYNDLHDTVYLIRTAFWSHYASHGGPSSYGAPCEDEHIVSGKTEQAFQYATFRWTGSKVKVRHDSQDNCSLTRTISASGEEQTSLDDYPDLLVYYPTMGGWWLARNSGTTATYYANLFQNMYTQGANEHWYLPVPNDFSGDGYDDLIIYTQAGDWSGIASSNHTWPIAAYTITSSYGGSTQDYYPYTGDFNGDGYADALLYGTWGDYYVRFSNGTIFTWDDSDWMPSCACGAQPAPETQFHILITDLNGDTQDDLLLYEYTTGNWYGALSTQDQFSLTTWYTGFGAQTPHSTTFHILAGDITGDGNSDAVIHGTYDGHWNSLISTGSRFSTQTLFYQAGFGTATDQVFLKDMNADGKDDAVVFTPTTGTWQVAYSTGTSFAWPPITLITNFGTDPSGSYGVQGFLVEVVP